MDTTTAHEKPVGHNADHELVCERSATSSTRAAAHRALNTRGQVELTSGVEIERDARCERSCAKREPLRGNPHQIRHELDDLTPKNARTDVDHSGEKELLILR